MYIAIEVGGTTLRIAGVNQLHDVHTMQTTHFSLTHTFEKDFSTLLDEITNLSQGKIEGIGVSLTGALNEDNSVMIDEAPNLIEWLHVPIKKLLSDKFNCPVFMDNDANIAGIGEAIYGAGKGENFAYCIWGTGIGGALIKMQHNRPTIERLNWYDYFEAWEEDCGGAKIQEHFGKSGAELSEEEWSQVMTSFAKHLHIFIDRVHPSTIIFGGGIALKQKQRLMTVTQQFSETIQVTGLGDNTGLFGCFALLKNNL